MLAAQANAEVAPAWRRVVTLLAGLAAVALVLLAAFRGDRRRALVPLVPIVAGHRLVGARSCSRSGCR